MNASRTRGTKRRPLFYPTWSEHERRSHILIRLLPAVSDSNLPEWAKRDVEFLLMDLGVGNKHAQVGAPRTSQTTQMLIARCLAWLDTHHSDLQKKQRNAIVAAVLNEKPRALTTLPAVTLDIAASTLVKWKEREGKGLVETLDREAAKRRAVQQKVRRKRSA